MNMRLRTIILLILNAIVIFLGFLYVAIAPMIGIIWSVPFVIILAAIIPMNWLEAEHYAKRKYND